MEIKKDNFSVIIAMDAKKKTFFIRNMNFIGTYWVEWMSARRYRMPQSQKCTSRGKSPKR